MTSSRYASRDPITAAQAVEFERLELLDIIISWENINQDKIANEIHSRWHDAMCAVYVEESFDGDDLGIYQYDFDQYLESIIKFATHGHVEAQFDLYIYYTVIGAFDDANQWLKKAASNGHYQAKFHLIKLFCVGNAVSSMDVDAAQRIANDLMRHIQEEYFVALAEDDSYKVNSFKRLYEQLIELNFQVINLLSIPILKSEPGVERLGKKNELDDAITALNHLTKIFQVYIVTPAQWIVANYISDEREQRIMIRENSSAPLRPMIKLEFKIDKGMISVTDNFLFKLLVIKMKLKYNGFSSVGAAYRACIISVEDPVLLAQIPELCATYIFQPGAAKSSVPTLANLSSSIIHDYTPIPMTLTKPDSSLVDKKRMFLLELKTEVNNSKWNNKALKFTLFGTTSKTPDQIEAMRNILRNANSESNAATVDFMFSEVKKLFIDHTSKFTRDPEVESLYSRTFEQTKLLSGFSSIGLQQTLRK